MAMAFTVSGSGHRYRAPGKYPYTNATFERDFTKGLNTSGSGSGPTVSFTRASIALYEDEMGVWRQVASGVPRIRSDWGVLIEEERTNKCTNYNAEPDAALTGLTKGGDAAATLSRVLDTTALTNASLDQLCSSGYVVKLDNSAGSTEAFVDVAGATGDTAKHAVSAFVRVTGGTAGIKLDAVAGEAITTSVVYTRLAKEELVPSSVNDVLRITASAGAVVYFVLNQLENNKSVTTPIITSGASATRAADVVSMPSDNLYFDEISVLVAIRRTGSLVPFPSYPNLLLMGNATATNYQSWSVSTYGGANTFNLVVTVAGSGQQVNGSGTTVMGMDTEYRVGGTCKTNDFRMYVNGSMELLDEIGATLNASAINTVYIGCTHLQQQQPNAWIRGVSIYPTALSQTEMEVLTA